MNAARRLPDRFLREAGDLVRRRTGLVFNDGRWPDFEAALVTAVEHSGLAEPDHYLTALAAGPELLDDLVDRITVGETYFFRDPQQFALIRNALVPRLLAERRPGHRLRIWSAGCATGEEPYSLAIAMRELGLGQASSIVATDLSHAALAKARRAVYPRWSLRGASDHLLAYFSRSGGRFELVPAIRDAVQFGHLNLAEDTYPSLPSGIWGMDLILCRNVLIYFDAATVAQVAHRLIETLSGGGWLLLGASDPPLGELVACDVEITAAGLAYRRPGQGSAHANHRPRADTEVILSRRLPSPRPLPGASARTAAVGPAAASEARAPDSATAMQCYAERDYERASALAAELLATDDDDPRLWIVLVRALANRGRLEAAGQACVAALRRHRASAELVYLHATLLLAAGCHRECAVAARQALYLDRTMVMAHVALGAALARAGDVAGAGRALRNAERLLGDMAPGEAVPASDGESAGAMLQMTRMHLQLLTGTGS